MSSGVLSRTSGVPAHKCMTEGQKFHAFDIAKLCCHSAKLYIYIYVWKAARLIFRLGSNLTLFIDAVVQT